MDALSERNRHTGTSAMRVFANHIYEYKKGVRRMILFTVNDRYVGEAVKRLKLKILISNYKKSVTDVRMSFSAVVNVSRWCGG